MQQPGSNFNPYAPPTADIDQRAQLGHDDQYVLADRGTRLGAFIIDYLLLMASMLPAGVILAFMAYANQANLNGLETEWMLIGVGVVMFLMVLSFAIYQLYLISTTGQSLAKRWLGIKIVRIDGSPAGFVHGVLLRSFVTGALGAIPFIGWIISIVDPLMIFGEERRCLHDHIAGTRVIVAPIAG